MALRIARLIQMQHPIFIFCAFIAILLWASLAMTASLLKGIPPFYQLTFAFMLGALPVFIKGKKAFPTRKTLVLGVAGLFGYHFFLFTAFRLAPPVEANLINYLWPMLMVMLAPLFFRDSSLKMGHFVGAGLALVGVVILVTQQEVTLTRENLLGYFCALAAAIIWPVYSLLKRKTPGEAVITTAGICLIASLLCALTHFVVEERVAPTQEQWYLLLWLGTGPFGSAFYLWDFSLKKGDPRIIGALSYLTPVLSTVLLVFVANQSATSATWMAMLFMSVGSLVGAGLSR